MLSFPRHIRRGLVVAAVAAAVAGPSMGSTVLAGPSLNHRPSGPSLNGPSLNVIAGPSLNRIGGPSLNGPSLNGPSLN